MAAAARIRKQCEDRPVRASPLSPRRGFNYAERRVIALRYRGRNSRPVYKSRRGMCRGEGEESAGVIGDMQMLIVHRAPHDGGLLRAELPAGARVARARHTRRRRGPIARETHHDDDRALAGAPLAHKSPISDRRARQTGRV